MGNRRVVRRGSHAPDPLQRRALPRAIRAEWHAQRSDGEALLTRDGVEGRLQQPAVLLTEALLALFTRSHQVMLGTVSREHDTSPLGRLARLGAVDQHLLDLAVMGLVQ